MRLIKKNRLRKRKPEDIQNKNPGVLRPGFYIPVVRTWINLF